MKQWLILGGVLALAVLAMPVGATPGSVPQQQNAMDAKQAPPAAMQQTRQQQQPAAPRHLSEQQRAELRKQLQQFNQQYTRRP